MASGASGLSRKQTSVHEDWLPVLARFYDRPDTARARQLVDVAAERVERATAGRSAAYGWSGGKDSQGLRIVCEAAGVEACVLVISELEYPAFLGWATDHMPHGLTVEARPLDMGWLRRHQDMLFPQDARTAAKWFKAVQHDGQRDFCARAGVDALLIGRRIADGNHCGPGGIYQDRGKFLRVSPLYDWSHEDLLCVLGAHRAPLPPCYGWPRGFRVGTGPWPARQWCPSLADGWAEVRAIDSTVVEHAAECGILGAREALCAG